MGCNASAGLRSPRLCTYMRVRAQRHIRLAANTRLERGPNARTKKRSPTSQIPARLAEIPGSGHTGEIEASNAFSARARCLWSSKCGGAVSATASPVLTLPLSTSAACDGVWYCKGSSFPLLLCLVRLLMCGYCEAWPIDQPGTLDASITCTRVVGCG